MLTLSSIIAGAVFAQGMPADAIAFESGKPMRLKLASVPVPYRGDNLSIVQAGEATVYFETHRLEPKPVMFPLMPPPPVYRGRIYVDWPPAPKPAPFPFLVKFEPRLRANLKLAVAQYNKVEYRIYGAAYDANGRLLGTAVHIEPVEYIRLGLIPTMFRDVVLDFGVSESFAQAKFVAFAVSQPPVPKPPDAD